jgi:hypothetical protein
VSKASRKTFDPAGGWASHKRQRDWGAKWSYLPGDPLGPFNGSTTTAYGEPESAAAVVDFWTRPHELAVDDDMCDRLTDLSDGRWDTYVDELMDPADREDLIARLRAANERWWGLDLTVWNFRVKKYGAKGSGGPKSHFPAHSDWHPGGGVHRKLAAVVQLTDPDTYEGCDLSVYHCLTPPKMDNFVFAPRERGTLLVMPGWTYHEVSPCTRGARFMLAADGWGPRLR